MLLSWSRRGKAAASPDARPWRSSTSNQRRHAETGHVSARIPAGTATPPPLPLTRTSRPEAVCSTSATRRSLTSEASRQATKPNRTRAWSRYCRGVGWPARQTSSSISCSSTRSRTSPRFHPTPRPGRSCRRPANRCVADRLSTNSGPGPRPVAERYARRAAKVAGCSSAPIPSTPRGPASPGRCDTVSSACCRRSRRSRQVSRCRTTAGRPVTCATRSSAISRSWLERPAAITSRSRTTSSVYSGSR